MLKKEEEEVNFKYWKWTQFGQILATTSARDGA